VFVAIQVPPLLLTANVSSIFEICAQIVDASDRVTCDACRVVVAETMALCALVAALSRVQRVGKDVQALGLSPHLKQLLENCDILSRSLHASEGDKDSAEPEYLHAYRVKTEAEATGSRSRSQR
jgi:anti-anti-sigma regulatory factor